MPENLFINDSAIHIVHDLDGHLAVSDMRVLGEKDAAETTLVKGNHVGVLSAELTGILISFVLGYCVFFGGNFIIDLVKELTATFVIWIVGAVVRFSFSHYEHSECNSRWLLE